MTKNKNKENFQSAHTVSKAEGIIKNLVNLVGVTAGIILTSIGAIMFLDSVFKLYVFDVKQDRYNNWEYQCQQYDIDSIEARRLVGDNFVGPLGAIEIRPKKEVEKEDKKLTKEEKEFLEKKFKECKKEAKETAEKNFQRREKMDIADGIAFMVVGFALLYFYQRRRKSKK